MLTGCGLKNKDLRVGKARVKVEVRESQTGRQQGLSGRDSLGEDEGMLFVFEEPGYYKFWMKGMKFDLDFVWIDKDQVVEITERVGAPTVLTPVLPIDKVLEVNSGWVEKNGVKVGDKVE